MYCADGKCKEILGILLMFHANNAVHFNDVHVIRETTTTKTTKKSFLISRHYSLPVKNLARVYETSLLIM